MKDTIQKEYKALRLFGVKILEFSATTTLEGKNETKKPKDIITKRDYEILEEYRKKGFAEGNKYWWQE